MGRADFLMVRKLANKLSGKLWFENSKGQAFMGEGVASLLRAIERGGVSLSHAKILACHIGMLFTGFRSRKSGRERSWSGGSEEAPLEGGRGSRSALIFCYVDTSRQSASCSSLRDQ
jgi:hypothetical protein